MLEMVVSDVLTILFLGRRFTLKCLLRMRDMFAHDDMRYIMNTLCVNKKHKSPVSSRMVADVGAVVAQVPG